MWLSPKLSSSHGHAESAPIRETIISERNPVECLLHIGLMKNIPTMKVVGKAERNLRKPHSQNSAIQPGENSQLSATS